MWTVGSKPRLLRSLQKAFQAVYPAPVHDRPCFLSLNGRDDFARLHSRTRSVANFPVLGFGVRKAFGLLVFLFLACGALVASPSAFFFSGCLKTDYCRGEETEGVFDLWLQDRLFFFCGLFLSFFLRFFRNRRSL
jgi:hypothetical protein